MHLLVIQPGEISDGSEAVDLRQTPGDIIFLSAAATDLAILSEQHKSCDYPSLRLANLMQLGHNMSVDLYVENTIAGAKLVIIRLLGGLGYWSYGIEQIQNLCLGNNIKLAIVPGDDNPDPELTELSTLDPETCHRIWQYCVQSGADNIRHLLNYASSLIGKNIEWIEPISLVQAGLYWPGSSFPDLIKIRQHWTDGHPINAIIFYRSMLQTSDLAPIDSLIQSLQARNLNPLPIFVSSLKDPISAGILKLLLKETEPDIILNCTGFAVLSPGKEAAETPFSQANCPVIQVVLSGGNFEEWKEGVRGLSSKDLAMNVALPEVDGRLISRAISFKKSHYFDDATEVAVVKHQPVKSRIDFVAELAASWTRLRHTGIYERRVAVILANYPNKDGRLGNGVGLDTPAAIAVIFGKMREMGYYLTDEAPFNSKEIINLKKPSKKNL